MSPSCRAGKEEVGELLSTACSLLSFALPLLLFLALSVFPSSLGLFLRLSLSLSPFICHFPPSICPALLRYLRSTETGK